jgi:hypothetical protein
VGRPTSLGSVRWFIPECLRCGQGTGAGGGRVAEGLRLGYEAAIATAEGAQRFYHLQLTRYDAQGWWAT